MFNFICRLNALLLHVSSALGVGIIFDNFVDRLIALLAGSVYSLEFAIIKTEDVGAAEGSSIIRRRQGAVPQPAFFLVVVVGVRLHCFLDQLLDSHTIVVGPSYPCSHSPSPLSFLQSAHFSCSPSSRRFPHFSQVYISLLFLQPLAD